MFINKQGINFLESLLRDPKLTTIGSQIIKRCMVYVLRLFSFFLHKYALPPPLQRPLTLLFP